MLTSCTARGGEEKLQINTSWSSFPVKYARPVGNTSWSGPMIPRERSLWPNRWPQRVQRHMKKVSIPRETRRCIIYVNAAFDLIPQGVSFPVRVSEVFLQRSGRDDQTAPLYRRAGALWAPVVSKKKKKKHACVLLAGRMDGMDELGWSG